MSNLNKLDMLAEGDKEVILEVYTKLRDGVATYHDLGEVMRVAQQNVRVFEAFDLTLILRIAEYQFKHSSNIEHGYIKDNLVSAFGIV
jgi:hypothetical protein